MKEQTKEALELYYARGDSWAADRNDALRSSRRVAWWVAAGASAIAFLEAIAIVVLTPLKTVEPYTLLVDRQTGFVQTLKPLDAQLVSSDRALTQSFLAQYVIAREGFDIDGLQSDYRKVALWSAGAARSGYLAAMQATNPDSPLARLPRSTVLDVRIKSITSLSAASAMVRFDVSRRDTGGQLSSPQPYLAVLRYEYSGEPMSLDDRMINPLGFKVTRYRRSMEAPPPVQVPASPTMQVVTPDVAQPPAPAAAGLVVTERP